jgi:DNA-binding CsgD family transcriptional regulator
MSYSLETLTAFSEALDIFYRADSPAEALHAALPCLGLMLDSRPVRVEEESSTAVQSRLPTLMATPLVTPPELPPTKACNQLSFVMRQPQSAIGVTFHRDRPFDADEHYLLSLLQTHFDAAVRSSRRRPSGPSRPATPAGEKSAADFFRLQAFGLTPRECEVAFWVAQGNRDAEIARRLDCAVRTVSKHVENLLAKTGAETRAGATYTAQEWLRRPG